MRLFGRKLRWDFLERRLSHLCRLYSLIVVDHTIPFIVAPILFTLLAAGGWAFKRDYIDATELYTPQDAQSRFDQRAITERFPQTDGSFQPGKMVVVRRECNAIVLAGDGGNILRPRVSKAVEKLNEFIMNQIVVGGGEGEGGSNASTYSYQDLCMKSGSSCYNNPQIYIIPLMFAGTDGWTNLSYPTATHDDQRFYLGATLGGVTLDPGSKRIVDAKAWYLLYKLKDDTPEENRLSKLFEREYEKRILSYRDPLVNVSVFHSQTLDLEVIRNADTLVPRFTIMFSLLIVFAVACTLSCRCSSSAPAKSITRKFAFDWTLSRPLLAILGVVGAAMGVATAIGLLCYVQYGYNNIVSVMPFLIIAVRLDNTFLMIAALDNTKRTLPVRERVSEAMAEAAVSITITVLTDMFSFAFGVLTDFQAVIIFSIYTTLAIIITWVYQLTFLLGFLVVFARLEEKRRHAVITCKQTLSMDEYESHSLCKRLCCFGSHPPTVIAAIDNVIPMSESTTTKPPIDTAAKKASEGEIENDSDDDNEIVGTPISRWFRDFYGRILMKRETKAGVILLLIGFWAVSIYGCYNLRLGLEPIRLLVDDSYAIPYYYYLEKYFWDYGQQVQIVIFNPGDLSNATDRGRIFDVINAFADLPHSTGREGIEFWMTAFDQFLDTNQGFRLADLPSDQFYEKLNFFLFSFPQNLRYRLDVAFRNGSGPGDYATNPLIATRAMVGVKGFGSLTGQQATMDSFRSLANAYNSFNISTFHVMFIFIDQYEDIWPNVEQEVLSCTAVMIVISLLLIPHPICAIWVTFAILSIDVGVVGFMTLWGLNMDTISMITIIMSIGFSVDFSAHIAYSYVMNIHEEPDMRVRKALGNLGWPVLQGGLATVLGVVTLSTAQSYMVVSFYKTVFLVIVFGLLHGLVILPVLMNLLMPARLCGFQCIRSAENVDDRRRGEGGKSEVEQSEDGRRNDEAATNDGYCGKLIDSCKLWWWSRRNGPKVTAVGGAQTKQSTEVKPGNDS